MLRSSKRECEVPACRHARPFGVVCPACWKRAPIDLRDAVKAARAARAPHLRSAADMALVDWLVKHPTAASIARVTGEKV